MLDKELMEQMQANCKDIQSFYLFRKRLGIMTLKDLLWEEINKESNQLIELEHQPLFESSLQELRRGRWG